MRTPTPDEVGLVYLSGPMSKFGPPDFGYATFRLAAYLLREYGYDVINPAETAGGITHLGRETFMRLDTGYVTAANSVVLLPGWEGSNGSKLEAMLGYSMGHKLYEFDEQTGIGSQIKLLDWSVSIVRIP